MRTSLVRSLGPAIFGGVIALMAIGAGAFAGDVETERVVSEGDQISSGAEEGKVSAQSPTNIPDDNLGPANADGSGNRVVRQLLAARPGEDLIICMAGCFSDRDRVIYAQPANPKAASGASIANPAADNDSSDGSSGQVVTR